MPRLSLIALCAAAMLLAACSQEPEPRAVSSDVTEQHADLAPGDEPVDLDPATFTADIDNPYWPMEPRTRWTYREIDEEGTEVKVVVIVTTQTKKIANGITARVVRDTVTEDG